LSVPTGESNLIPDKHLWAGLGRLAPFHKVGFKPGEEIAARLESLGVAASEIDFIINSHLHFDHCGGNRSARLRPRARVKMIDASMTSSATAGGMHSHSRPYFRSSVDSRSNRR